MGTTVIPRGIRCRDNQVHEVVQSSAETQLVQTYPAFANAPYFFSLSQIDQATQWTAVFDQYRIAEIEVTIRPAFNVGQAGVNTVNWYSVVDYDDANPLTSAASMREYGNCLISQYETQVRRFTPHAAIAAYQGTFVGFANVVAPWLDAASTTVQHYSIKLGMDPGPAAIVTAQTLTVQFKYRIQFRNVH
jgi:hypothetical protein